ncbi:phosphonate ABC transporter ATP-binding protein [Deinococcus sp.]|uniref:phosphonate ABC transporter ATP-binding protein n=1 Tax=Deinococcus sp. TaxID=47478 RepID=UPI0025C1083F|nr:phosphonate ABC transporter ATP-binding protein [Deinococcus sp.]
MIDIKHLHVNYRGKPALQDVTVHLGSGFTAIIGPSGAGKSTLMRSINGLVPITDGDVLLEGHSIGKPGSAALRAQQRHMGMVFQQFNLVRRLSALDNVLLGCLGRQPQLLGALGLAPKADRAFAMHLLDRVGLAEHAWKRADQLSGGQQQRVGIARALAQQPRVILADEPISALDPKSSEQVMHILRSIHEDDGLTVIANLHFLDTVRQYATRVVALKAGQLVFDTTPDALTRELTRELYDHDPPAVQGAEPPVSVNQLASA